MSFRKTLVVVGVVGAVAAAVLAGTAFAQTPTPTPNQQAKTNYQNLYLDKLAAALGTTTDKLKSAFTQARNDTVDQAVKDGKLTQAQADKIKAQQGTAPFGFGFGFRGGEGPGKPEGGAGFRMGGADIQNAIAQALGMSVTDLQTQLKSGKTLAQLAQGKEQAVKDAIAGVVKPKLDQAVKAGKLTQDQENQMLSKIQNSDLSQMGPWGMMKRGAPRGNGNATPTPRPSSRSAVPATGAL